LGVAVGAFAISAFRYVCKSHCGRGGKCGKRGGGCGSKGGGCGSKGKCCGGEKGAYELTYFPIRGRVEIPRLILEDAGEEYKIVNVGDGDMKALKASGDLAFGQVPLLTHGDLKLVQSNAIIRYLGRHLNRYGQGPRERALIDVAMDGAEDLRQKYLRLIYGDQLADEAKAKYLDEVARAWFRHFEALLLKNNGGQGYFVGSEISIADYSIYEEVEKHTRIFPTLLSEFPLIKGWFTRFEARPNVAAYIKSGRRPVATNGNGKGN